MMWYECRDIIAITETREKITRRRYGGGVQSVSDVWEGVAKKSIR